MSLLSWLRGETKQQDPHDAKGVDWEDWPGFQEILTRGVPWSSYGAMYRKQPAVRTVVDFIARNIAQLNPKVYQRVGNTDRIEDDAHPLAVILRNPNPATSRYAHLRDTVADIAIYDRAYWEIGGRAFPTTISRIPPSQIRREENNRYVMTDGREIARGNLVVFKGYSPDGDDDGVSPLETLRRVLAEEWAAVEHREHFWINGARQSGYIKRPLDAPDWSDDARRRFRQTWDSSSQTRILEDGMEWVDSAFSPNESQYIEGRRLTYEEVSRAYGVPPALIGVGDAAKANIESFHRQVYQDVLGPWLRMLQDEIELQLLPRWDPTGRDRGRVYVEFNIGEKLKASFEEQSKTLVSSTGVPYISINEARARLNLPRINDPAFDSPVQPMNVMYGGQPAVTVPTEDPGSPRTASVKKAPAVAVRRRNETAKGYEKLLRTFFERQEAAVLSDLGSKGFKAVAWEEDRWNRELTVDLFQHSLTVTTATGTRAAREMNGAYDANRTLEFLTENARITAESINQHTRDAINEDLAKAREVFEDAKTNRAAQVGGGLATTLINFARTEAAKQSSEDGRQRTKTWIVTNPKSRHPEMNGETVPANENFSNGAAWPGDPSLSVQEAAGCQCLLQLGG